MTPPRPADPTLSAAQIDAALAVVTRTWPNERAGVVALVAAVLGLPDEEVAGWRDDDLEEALQVVADRLNEWADKSHAAGLARLSPRAQKRRGKPLTQKRRANLLKFHPQKAMAPGASHIGGTTNG